jgi:hypothetical protein
MKRRRNRKVKREALVHQHLENVSRDLLERHRDIVRTGLHPVWMTPT